MIIPTKIGVLTVLTTNPTRVLDVIKMEKHRSQMIWPFLIIATLLIAGSWYLQTKRRATESRLTHQEVIAEMRKRAELAVADAKKEYDIDLDFSPESVEDLDEILQQIHESHQSTPLASIELRRHSLKWGGYIGEVSKRIRDCEWAVDSKIGGKGDYPIVYKDRSESFPIGWCLRRIVNGEEDNVWHKFTYLVVNRDGDYLDALTEAGAQFSEESGEAEPNDYSE
ncbi:hypothetical protein Pan258_20310 [Symmachiella dynata]|uniref:hypothetical protein n=1 Tax=Symmachiella dynata TaxID=2527995 RepID=UPI001188FDD5|nr:hypothetical protein [Symmachiella dynata]QDT47991.1 hypothetical protein Pan258_20310 [Symmachiella dynata]